MFVMPVVISMIQLRVTRITVWLLEPLLKLSPRTGCALSVEWVRINFPRQIECIKYKRSVYVGVQGAGNLRSDG